MMRPLALSFKRLLFSDIELGAALETSESRQ